LNVQLVWVLQGRLVQAAPFELELLSSNAACHDSMNKVEQAL
jgi:hypothetical protein